MKFDAATVYTTYASPLGAMYVAATSRGLAGVWFQDQKHLPPELEGKPRWAEDRTHPALVKTMRQLDAYFAGKRKQFELPLDLGAGTAFQQAVWQALLQIAPGTTTSYGALSAAIGKPAAVRAVGSAIGRNPVGIVVPCHRVLGAGGALTGYAGGLERKSALLQLEGAL